jgi:hypothetical protein
VCALNDCICLQISCQDHFSFVSVIIDTHTITEILPNELTTMVKGYKTQSWIMCEPFLLNNVSDCNWFLVVILLDLEPIRWRINHSDTFQRRNLNSLYIAFNVLWTNEIDAKSVPWHCFCIFFQAEVHTFWIVPFEFDKWWMLRHRSISVLSFLTS